MSFVAAARRILTLHCSEAEALLESSAGELSFVDRWALRLHLLVCRACRRARRRIDELRDLVRRAARRLENEDGAGGPRLSDEARDRLRAALDDES